MPEHSMTRREFVTQSGVAAAATAINPVAAEADPPPKDKPTMKIGFHTDAFNSAYFSFDKCLEWAQKNGVHFIECGLIDGVSWAVGLGYFPHLALYEDPCCCGAKWRNTESSSRRWMRPIRSQARMDRSAACPT